MKLAKYRDAHGVERVAVLEDSLLIPLDLSGGQYSSLADILEEDNPPDVVEFLTERASSTPFDGADMMAPVDKQEIWAAGVTYRRSQTARMEESETSASCYDRVYESPRPELFLKATPHRVVGHGKPIRIRQDSAWNVPEPELTLVINSRKQLVGYSVGNDMSSRDIEGENPLYLPQAKVYNQCCGIGPCIALPSGMVDTSAIGIHMTIRRQGITVFEGSTDSGQMARGFQDLIEWLGRDNSFPDGAFLLTGTGIVPDSDFTLVDGDVVDISIDGIGTLSNVVTQGQTPVA